MNNEEYLLKQLFVELLEDCFSPSEIYQQFLIKVIPKELKNRLGRYKEFERIIEVNNLTRTPAELFFTCLHGLAIHINTVDKEYFSESSGMAIVLNQLVTAACHKNLFCLEEIQELEEKEKLSFITEHCGLISEKIQEEKLNQVNSIVEIANGFKIKGQLYKDGYEWNKGTKKWFRLFPTIEDAENEKHRVWELSDEATVKVTSRLDSLFAFHYYVSITPKANATEFLQENGYVYEAYGLKKQYIKKVPARLFFKERALLLSIEVPFKLVTVNQ